MNEAELDDLLSTPRAQTRETLDACSGDVIILGAGGKMGPTLARMVRRAATDGRRVIAVSRWSSASAERALNDAGVETVRCDLLERKAVDALPDAPNVIFMAGQKFGTTGAPALTWGMNTIVPAICAERYQHSRIVAFSTGNVYAFTTPKSGGSTETDTPTPVGEYAASCLGRERVFELYSERFGTPVSIVRLNYAIDLRYGVLVDIALRVHRGEPVPAAMGFVNVIWQGDANRIAIECLARAATPPFVVNVTGTDALDVRELAESFAARFNKPVSFTTMERATEDSHALLSNTSRMRATFAPPETTVVEMVDRVALWVEQGGALLGKLTKFESRDGNF